MQLSFKYLIEEFREMEIVANRKNPILHKQVSKKQPSDMVTKKNKQINTFGREQTKFLLYKK